MSHKALNLVRLSRKGELNHDKAQLKDKVIKTVCENVSVIRTNHAALEIQGETYNNRQSGI